MHGLIISIVTDSITEGCGFGTKKEDMVYGFLYGVAHLTSRIDLNPNTMQILVGG